MTSNYTTVQSIGHVVPSSIVGPTYGQPQVHTPAWTTPTYDYNWNNIMHQLNNLPNDLGTVSGISGELDKLFDGKPIEDVSILNDRIIKLHGLLAALDAYVVTHEGELPEVDILILTGKLKKVLNTYINAFKRLEKIATQAMDKINAYELGFKLAKEEKETT